MVTQLARLMIIILGSITVISQGLPAVSIVSVMEFSEPENENGCLQNSAEPEQQ